MSTYTSTTGKTSTSTPTSTDSTVRPGLRSGKQVVAVQFGAWGPQEVTVRAYSGGGRGGAPYVAVGVGVGTCLTYAYGTVAVRPDRLAGTPSRSTATCACRSSRRPPPPGDTRGRT